VCLIWGRATQSQTEEFAGRFQTGVGRRADVVLDAPGNILRSAVAASLLARPREGAEPQLRRLFALARTGSQRRLSAPRRASCP
jgi:hypothetical protein